jgi:PAS domain S-box-containing protein
MEKGCAQKGLLINQVTQNRKPLASRRGASRAGVRSRILYEIIPLTYLSSRVMISLCDNTSKFFRYNQREDMDNEIVIADLHSRIQELTKENENLRSRSLDIHKARDFYLKIFEEFPALIWRSRLDMKCDYFNKTWLDFTGRTMEQEFGNGWAEGVHPDDLDLCFKIYVDSFSERKSFKMEYRLKNRDGEYRWIRDIGRPFYDLDNVFAGYIGSCYDITEERKNANELRELNNTKDRFFSIIAHDLSGPMGGMKTVVEMLNRDFEKFSREQVTDIISLFCSTTEQVSDLLFNLLNWARSQQNLITLQPVAFNLMNLINEILVLFKRNIEQKKILFVNKVPEDFIITADINMMGTVFRNLLANAVKFSNTGGGVLIKAEYSDGFAAISVSDEGVGMEKHEIDNLFRIDVKQSRKGTAGEKGTGLGLIISREFVEKNRGRLEAASEPGKGSTFTVYLPR